MNPSRRTLLLAASASLAGCAAPEVSHYAGQQPELLPERYFNGALDAWGTFTNFRGEVMQRFVVTLQCRWQGPDGVLEEDFVFADGKRQRRVWKIRKTGDGTYEGTADDVVGPALGRAAGSALHWRYTLALPVDGRVRHVEMDDWMYLLTPELLINRTAMRKFGITVGEVAIAFRRRP